MKKTVIAFLFLASAAFADQTGRFDRNTSYEPPADHAPANVSRMFVKAVARSSSVDLPAVGDSGMIIWTVSDRGAVSARVNTPKGAAQRRFNIDGTQSEVVHVTNPVAATYRVDVEVPAGDTGVKVVAAEPESAVTLSTWAAPLSRQPGQPVTLQADLRDGERGIAGATVVARLASPSGKTFDTIALADQGNGVYRTTLAELPANIAGAWQVHFDAEGATASGIRFARTGLGELIAERGAAHFGAVRAEIAGDVLRITAPANVHIAGNYRLDVIVAGPAKADGTRASLAWAEGTRSLDRGRTELTIDIDRALIGDTRVEDLFLDVRLLGLDQIGVADRVTVP